MSVCEVLTQGPALGARRERDGWGRARWPCRLQPISWKIFVLAGHLKCSIKKKCIYIIPKVIFTKAQNKRSCIGNKWICFILLEDLFIFKSAKCLKICYSARPTTVLHHSSNLDWLSGYTERTERRDLGFETVSEKWNDGQIEKRFKTGVRIPQFPCHFLLFPRCRHHQGPLSKG